MIHVHKLNLPKADLATLSVEERSLFILAGHTLNAVVFWLKLIRRTSNQDGAAFLAATIEAAQTPVVIRSLLGAVVEAWVWLRRPESQWLIGQTYLPLLPEASQTSYAALKREFGEAGALYGFRNGFAYHHPKSSSVEAAFDKSPADEDWSLYLTDQHTTSSYLLCEMVLLHGQVADGAGLPSKTMAETMDKAVTIASALSDFLTSLLSTIVQHHFPQAQPHHVMDVRNAPAARQVTLPFYLEGW